MYISAMRLQDFRCFQSAEIGFAPLTIIRGVNHQGKSSIAHALQLATTGRAQGTDAWDNVYRVIWTDIGAKSEDASDHADWDHPDYVFSL